jgi:type I restriction enzyme S subunit
MSKFKRYERYKDSGVEWIGEIPEHWNISKLKYLTYCLDEKRIPLSSEQRGEMQGDIPYWGANCIIDYVNDWIIDGEVVLLGEDGAPFFDRNKDVAFYSNEKIWPNNHVHVLRALQSINAKLLTYILNTVDYRNYINGSTRDKLTQSEMKNILIQLPSAQEQKAIANFLDQKTSEIDGLIADKEKLIELLQEKRQAVITEAVTKGLNPNVKMKDSGIEWIGEIPEHWNVEPIKYMVKTIQTGTTPTTKNDDYFDGDIQWFTPGDFHGSKELYEASRKISNLAVIDNEARLFPKNTVMIVGIGATVGKVAKLGVEGSFNQQITGLIVNEQRLNCDYLYYWLYINQETIKNISNYTTLPIINNEFVKNFECLSLPLDEQQAIVNYLNQKTSEIDDLILKIRLQIQKLKEYRQSLISEAVTGKIDVREFGSISEVI